MLWVRGERSRESCGCVYVCVCAYVVCVRERWRRVCECMRACVVGVVWGV